MASKSGSTQALLLSAVHFFGLITENGLPTPELEKLSQLEGRDRQEVWRRILMKAYPALFKLDLQRATTQQVSELLRKEGLSSPDTIRKSLNFFSLAAKDGGLKLSPHIKPYAGHKSSRARGSENRETIAQTPPVLEHQMNGSSKWQLALSKFPDFDPSWPDELRKNYVESLSQFCKNSSDDESKVSP
jgi:hypothetical protein